MSDGLPRILVTLETYIAIMVRDHQKVFLLLDSTLVLCILMENISCKRGSNLELLSHVLAAPKSSLASFSCMSQALCLPL